MQGTKVGKYKAPKIAEKSTKEMKKEKKKKTNRSDPFEGKLFSTHRFVII
jgi:hypothetical protein